MKAWLRSLKISNLPYKIIVLAAFFSLFSLIVLSVPQQVLAQATLLGDPIIWLQNQIAHLILIIAKWIGDLTLTLIGLLVDVAQFNNFIDAPAVQKGWVIVRDVCNMFFIIILLLIAFGSVFRIEEYQYKKILGKLLIMAVLINFSKMITGFFIDIAQVIMLTFVNGFKQAAAGNFVVGFHLSDIFQFSNQAGSTVSPVEGTAYLAAAAMALVTILITAVVVGVYLIVFLMRIIALWFLVIISPVAYALAAFPGDAKKYSSMWWEYFGKYASTGPILAFFLWLSLAVMQQSTNATGSGFVTRESTTKIPAATITNIGTSEILLSFIVNIMLLMGGLWMTQQLGVAGGKLAAAASSKIQSAGTAIAKSPFKAAWGATKLASKSANQSLVKATGGRVSFDPRDYMQAFKKARDDRRKEAYQDFAGRKQKFFKEWGSPTGAVRKLFGGIGRSKGESEKDRLDKVRKEKEEALKRGHKGTEYREKLEKEELGNTAELAKLETDIALASGPERQGLEAKRDKLQARQNEIRGEEDEDGNKITDGLLDKNDDELSSLYKEKLEQELKEAEDAMKKYEEKATTSDDMVVPVKIEEIKDGIKLIEEEMEGNEFYLNTLRDLKEGKGFKDEKGNVKSLDNLKDEVSKTEVQLSEISTQKQAAKAKGDTKEVKRLETQEESLGLKKRLLENVQIKYTENLNNINTTKERLKGYGEQRKEKSNQLAEAQRQAASKDEAESATGHEKASVLKQEINGIEQNEKKDTEELKKHTDEQNKIKGDNRGIENKIQELSQHQGDLDQQITVQEQEKTRLIGMAPEDVGIIAEEIRKGWAALSEQNQNKAEALKATIEAKDLSRSDQAMITEEIKSIKKRVEEIDTAWYQTKEPAGYYIEQERRYNTAEEKKKITTENSEELASEFKKAVASKNKARAKALVMKLTEDANLNELMNEYGENSNFEGLNSFREKVLQKELGLDEQEALQFQNDVSYSAEGVGHWASARTVGFNVTTGKYYAMDEEEHTKAALAEIMKMQPRQIVSSLNRLAYGGEKPNADGSRSFQIDKLGQAIVIAAQNVISKEIGHLQINSATNLSQPGVMAVLRDLAEQGKIQSSVLRQIQSRVASSSERTPNELVDFLMKGS